MLKNLLRTTFGCFVPRSSPTVGNVYGRRATALTARDYSKTIVVNRLEQTTTYVVPEDGMLSAFAESHEGTQVIAGVESASNVWLSLVNNINGLNQCSSAFVEKGETIRIHTAGNTVVAIKFTPFK